MEHIVGKIVEMNVSIRQKQQVLPFQGISSPSPTKIKPNNAIVGRKILESTIPVYDNTSATIFVPQVLPIKKHGSKPPQNYRPWKKMVRKAGRKKRKPATMATATLVVSSHAKTKVPHKKQQLKLKPTTPRRTAAAPKEKIVKPNLTEAERRKREQQRTKRAVSNLLKEKNDRVNRKVQSDQRREVIHEMQEKIRQDNKVFIPVVSKIETVQHHVPQSNHQPEVRTPSPRPTKPRVPRLSTLGLVKKKKSSAHRIGEHVLVDSARKPPVPRLSGHKPTRKFQTSKSEDTENMISISNQMEETQARSLRSSSSSLATSRNQRDLPSAVKCSTSASPPSDKRLEKQKALRRNEARKYMEKQKKLRAQQLREQKKAREMSLEQRKEKLEKLEKERQDGLVLSASGKVHHGSRVQSISGLKPLRSSFKKTKSSSSIERQYLLDDDSESDQQFSLAASEFLQPGWKIEASDTDDSQLMNSVYTKQNDIVEGEESSQDSDENSELSSSDEEENEMLSKMLILTTMTQSLTDRIQQLHQTKKENDLVEELSELDENEEVDLETEDNDEESSFYGEEEESIQTNEVCQHGEENNDDGGDESSAYDEEEDTSIQVEDLSVVNQHGESYTDQSVEDEEESSFDEEEAKSSEENDNDLSLITEHDDENNDDDDDDESSVNDEEEETFIQIEDLTVAAERGESQTDQSEGDEDDSEENDNGTASISERINEQKSQRAIENEGENQLLSDLSSSKHNLKSTREEGQQPEESFSNIRELPGRNIIFDLNDPSSPSSKLSHLVQGKPDRSCLVQKIQGKSNHMSTSSTEFLLHQKRNLPKKVEDDLLDQLVAENDDSFRVVDMVAREIIQERKFKMKQHQDSHSPSPPKSKLSQSSVNAKKQDELSTAIAVAKEEETDSHINAYNIRNVFQKTPISLLKSVRMDKIDFKEQATMVKAANPKGETKLGEVEQRAEEEVDVKTKLDEEDDIGFTVTENEVVEEEAPRETPPKPTAIIYDFVPERSQEQKRYSPKSLSQRLLAEIEYQESIDATHQQLNALEQDMVRSQVETTQKQMVEQMHSEAEQQAQFEYQQQEHQQIIEQVENTMDSFQTQMIKQVEGVLTELHEERQHYHEVLQKSNQRESITQTESVPHFTIATETTPDVSIPSMAQIASSPEPPKEHTSSLLPVPSVSTSLPSPPAPSSKPRETSDIAVEENEELESDQSSEISIDFNEEFDYVEDTFEFEEESPKKSPLRKRLISNDTNYGDDEFENMAEEDENEGSIFDGDSIVDEADEHSAADEAHTSPTSVKSYFKPRKESILSTSGHAYTEDDFEEDSAVDEKNISPSPLTKPRKESILSASGQEYTENDFEDEVDEDLFVKPQKEIILTASGQEYSGDDFEEDGAESRSGLETNSLDKLKQEYHQMQGLIQHSAQELKEKELKIQEKEKYVALILELKQKMLLDTRKKNDLEEKDRQINILIEKKDRESLPVEKAFSSPVPSESDHTKPSILSDDIVAESDIDEQVYEEEDFENESTPNSLSISHPEVAMAAVEENGEAEEDYESSIDSDLFEQDVSSDGKSTVDVPVIAEINLSSNVQGSEEQKAVAEEIEEVYESSIDSEIFEVDKVAEVEIPVTTESSHASTVNGKDVSEYQNAVAAVLKKQEQEADKEESETQDDVDEASNPSQLSSMDYQESFESESVSNSVNSTKKKLVSPTAEEATPSLGEATEDNYDLEDFESNPSAASLSSIETKSKDLEENEAQLQNLKKQLHNKKKEALDIKQRLSKEYRKQEIKSEEIQLIKEIEQVERSMIEDQDEFQVLQQQRKQVEAEERRKQKQRHPMDIVAEMEPFLSEYYEEGEDHRDGKESEEADTSTPDSIHGQPIHQKQETKQKVENTMMKKTDTELMELEVDEDSFASIPDDDADEIFSQNDDDDDIQSIIVSIDGNESANSFLSDENDEMDTNFPTTEQADSILRSPVALALDTAEQEKEDDQDKAIEREREVQVFSLKQEFQPLIDPKEEINENRPSISEDWMAQADYIESIDCDPHSALISSIDQLPTENKVDDGLDRRDRLIELITSSIFTDLINDNMPLFSQKVSSNTTCGAEDTEAVAESDTLPNDFLLAAADRQSMQWKSKDMECLKFILGCQLSNLSSILLSSDSASDLCRIPTDAEIHEEACDASMDQLHLMLDYLNEYLLPQARQSYPLMNIVAIEHDPTVIFSELYHTLETFMENGDVANSSSIDGKVSWKKVMTHQKQVRDQAEKLAFQDTLTSLYDDQVHDHHTGDRKIKLKSPTKLTKVHDQRNRLQDQLIDQIWTELLHDTAQQTSKLLKKDDKRL